jgi:hypothetical protein
MDDGMTGLDHIELMLFENQIFLKEIQIAVERADVLYKQGVFKPGRYNLSIDNTIVPDISLQRMTAVSEDLQTSPETLRLLLRDQLYRSMICLDRIARGQGRLVDVTLPLERATVMDPYQALHYVALRLQHRIKKLRVNVTPMDACSTY